MRKFRKFFALMMCVFMSMLVQANTQRCLPIPTTNLSNHELGCPRATAEYAFSYGYTSGGVVYVVSIWFVTKYNTTNCSIIDTYFSFGRGL